MPFSDNGSMYYMDCKYRMLGDLERDVDETNERMNFVMGKLSQLLKTKGRCLLPDNPSKA